MAGNLQQVSVAEREVSGGEHRFERPCHLVSVLVECASLPVRHAVLVPPILTEHLGWAIREMGIAAGVERIRHLEGSEDASDNRFVTCVTRVELLKQSFIPAFIHAMATVKLQLVILALVVLLDSVSGLVGILKVFV